MPLPWKRRNGLPTTRPPVSSHKPVVAKSWEATTLAKPIRRGRVVWKTDTEVRVDFYATGEETVAASDVEITPRI